MLKDTDDIITSRSRDFLKCGINLFQQMLESAKADNRGQKKQESYSD